MMDKGMKEMEVDANRPVTLFSVLCNLPSLDQVFILHRMGPHELEAAGGGTVRELANLRCVDVCGDNLVERVELATDAPEWMGVDTPVWVITIGKRRRTKNG